MRRRGLLGAALATPLAARAAEFPSRSLRIIVPYGPGGASDIVARMMAQHASELTGQGFVVENRGGGATVPGTQAVIGAPADGYTLGTADNALVLNPAMLRDKLPYDSEREVGALGLVVTSPLLLLAHPAAPARRAAEVVAAARARPGLGLSHGGIGAPTQLGVVQFILASGAEFQPVGYRGGGPQLIGLVSGEVQYGFVALSSALAHVQAGRLRPLAVTGTARTPLLPAVPSMAEAGFPGVDIIGWWGFITPMGLADAVRERLHALLVAPAREPALRERLEGQGYAVVANRPEAFSTQIGREISQWRELVAKAGVIAE